MYTYRKLILFSSVSERGGNCKVLDDTLVLTVPSTSRSLVHSEFDISLYRRYNFDVIKDIQCDHDYDISSDIIELNEVVENVVTYISGYIVKMLIKIVKCQECIDSCLFNDEEINSDMFHYRFLIFKNKGREILFDNK